MAVEVIYNPMVHVVNVLVLLTCLTALTFIAVVLLCGIRPSDLAD